jgi:hypothetical protein
MNERVLEIAKKASDDIGMVGFHNIPTEFTKKFAELIVKECVDIIQRESEKAIRNNTYMGDDVPASVTQWKIKEHFGV